MSELKAEIKIDSTALMSEIAGLKASLATETATILQLIADKAESTSLAQRVIDSFETKTENMNFGEALEAAKNGGKIARRGWNGKGQYVFLIGGMELTEFVAKNKFGGFATGALAIKTSNDVIQVGWLASQTDILASDWYLLKKED